MSKSDVWFPMAQGDYLRDTMHLTTEQHGAYLLIIFDYYSKEGPPPDDQQYLSAVARMPIECDLDGKPIANGMANRWQSTWQVISRFFYLKDGYWHHKRIDAELELRKTRAEAGKRGANSKWHGKPMANGMRNGCGTDGKTMVSTGTVRTVPAGDSNDLAESEVIIPTSIEEWREICAKVEPKLPEWVIEKEYHWQAPKRWKGVENIYEQVRSVTAWWRNNGALPNKPQNHANNSRTNPQGPINRNAGTANEAIKDMY